MIPKEVYEITLLVLAFEVITFLGLKLVLELLFLCKSRPRSIVNLENFGLSDSSPETGHYMPEIDPDDVTVEERLWATEHGVDEKEIKETVLMARKLEGE